MSGTTVEDALAVVDATVVVPLQVSLHCSAIAGIPHWALTVEQ